MLRQLLCLVKTNFWTFLTTVMGLHTVAIIYLLSPQSNAPYKLLLPDINLTSTHYHHYFYNLNSTKETSLGKSHRNKFQIFPLKSPSNNKTRFSWNRLYKFQSIKLRVKHTTQGECQHSQNTVEPSDTTAYFRVKLQGTQSKLIREIFSKFDILMTKKEVPYMIYGGTLIGSYRHHGLVPWDDDLDVLIPVSARSKLHREFSNAALELILNTDSRFCWKLFSTGSEPIRGLNWRWPYLDIFFYDQNDTHIWDIAPQYRNNFVYPKTIIFPLKRRPFNDLFLLAPQNPRAVIDTNYNISLCKSGSWIHKWERWGKERTVLCSVLFPKFPFVCRTFKNGGCNETLVQNGRTVSYFFDEKVRC